MDSFECAKTLRGLVHVIGGAWLLAPETYERAPGIGLEPGMDYYYAGRFGVLGDAPLEVVASSAVFVAEPTLAAAFERATRAASPTEISADFVLACHGWGRSHFDAGPATEAVVALGGRVTAGASPVAAPLFAGWRAQPLPDDQPAAAAQILHIIRELRMARHAVAIATVGLDPLEAIVAGPGGEANAEMFGWPRPYPDPVDFKDRRDQAEQLTTELVARDLETLDAGERGRLVEAASELRRMV